MNALTVFNVLDACLIGCALGVAYLAVDRWWKKRRIEQYWRDTQARHSWSDDDLARERAYSDRRIIEYMIRTSSHPESVKKWARRTYGYPPEGE